MSVAAAPAATWSMYSYWTSCVYTGALPDLNRNVVNN